MARADSDSLWFFFFSSRRRHTRFKCDWSSDVCSSDLGECSVAVVVKEATLSERGYEEVVEAVVVVIADRYTHAIHFHIEAGFVGYVSECSIVIVVIKLGSGVLLLMTRPVHPIDQKNVGPAIVIVIDESDARAERFRQEFLSERAIVVSKANAGLLSYVAKGDCRSGGSGGVAA